MPASLTDAFTGGYAGWAAQDGGTGGSVAAIGGAIELPGFPLPGRAL